MFIPLGTIVKDENDIKKFCVGKNINIRACWFNDTREFHVSEYYSTYSAIQSRDYVVECETVESGYKVKRVRRIH
jgi:hypothetical protein